MSKHCPLKVPLSMGNPATIYLIRGSVGPPESTPQKDILIGSAVLAQLMVVNNRLTYT